MVGQYLPQTNEIVTVFFSATVFSMGTKHSQSHKLLEISITNQEPVCKLSARQMLGLVTEHRHGILGLPQTGVNCMSCGQDG